MNGLKMKRLLTRPLIRHSCRCWWRMKSTLIASLPLTSKKSKPIETVRLDSLLRINCPHSQSW